MAPMLSPDFSEVVELKPGSYNARLEDVESKTSAKGTMYLRWKLTVVGNSEPALNGKNFYHNTMVSGPGARGLRDLIRATLDPSYEQGEVDTDQMIGKEIAVVLRQGKNQDGSASNFPEVASVARLG